MLFKDMEYRYCVNCALAADCGEDSMICSKKGVVRKDSKCASFSYDPLKRDPARPHPGGPLRGHDGDFSL